jgi:pimeloyl-ACP methyl ester carboxylesterase
MSEVRAAVEASLPDADILAPDYPSGPLSNTDPMVIAESLLDLLDAATSDHDYESILLVGHSLGALLVRKLYVLALGFTEEGGVGLAGRPREWAEKVSRIVLLAGVNRGWNLSPKAKHMAWPKWVLLKLGSRCARLIRRGALIHGVRRGSPFVANLRVQWIRAATAKRTPLTVQLLGTIDDVVAAEDNADVECEVDFRFLRLPETGHANAIDFSGDVGRRRRQIFVKALVDPDPPSDFLSSDAQRLDVEHVVFIMHGIRDRGYWTLEIAEKLRALALSRHAQYRVVRSGYGYFPMLRFLLLAERQKNVRWFMDEYTEALAKYPNARFGFIGHSNGTYLLASALQRYRSCQFERAAFAGSVVPTRFPWDDLVRRKALLGIRNYVASADGIVGIFPGFYELIGWGDLGSAGHNGFTDGDAMRHQVTFVKGGHSAALDPAIHDSLIGFVIDGAVTDIPAPHKVGERSAFVVWLSKLNWVVWVLLAVVLLVGAVVVGQRFGLSYLALYIGTVLLLLYTT